VSNLSNVCILVVEDDEDSALLMGEVLREHGFTVEIAHDGVTALETATRCSPDIGVLDLGLPDMDGFELARRLRQLPETGPRMQLVALSGYGSAEDVREAHAAGFNLHLTKPILPGSLASTLTARLPAALKGSQPNGST
jgi:CheY-like chemotaxis protein